MRHGLIMALQAAVPLRMLELAERPPDEVVRIARAQSTAIGERGDVAMFGGKHAGEAVAAIITGLAALAVVADGGVTFAGMHWCVTDDATCPNGGPTWPAATLDRVGGGR